MSDRAQSGLKSSTTAEQRSALASTRTNIGQVLSSVLYTLHGFIPTWNVLLSCCSTQRARDAARSRLAIAARRIIAEPPSTGHRAAIAMDGGMADTACYYTGC
jgi:hypothetical protein